MGDRKDLHQHGERRGLSEFTERMLLCQAQGDDNGDYDQICGSGEMTGEDWDDSNSYVIMLKTSLTCIVVTSFL
jgi:hypothetical protein